MLALSSRLKQRAKPASPPSSLPVTRPEWQAALDALPSTPEHIPSFFFGHGSPMLSWPESKLDDLGPMRPLADHLGPKGMLAAFLRDFGPALLAKYAPKGILVFSAHWETDGERLVTDYGDENPLLMDYFGFDAEMYELAFSSRGDGALSRRVAELFQAAGMPARLTTRDEPRGQDGRGFMGPGLDHGVFVPFRLMFGERFRGIPIVQASIDGSLSPEDNWAVGRAVAQLRREGILVLAGGLTVHNLRDRRSFIPQTADPIVLAFNDAVSAAISTSDPVARRKAMVELARHPGFRMAHPREDHFVPLYVGAGAGEEGDVRVVSGVYGAQTVAFGI
ncbi:Extradiol ring-cleavage dioxygenase class III enzyme subunit B [Artomyces pyxidatus]|uniref:Extradiol ring-cleavage dioxygenase class III enzyme subunit B n=1 Tax=Artomyces pyxidatus TaxID=48021 RepID=A0ACB8T8A1_9AGAM|nr:Extradiol ring-cleavage dioxygenase class III enzyme subunit B [Artomyces pyxidatus]